MRLLQLNGQYAKAMGHADALPRALGQLQRHLPVNETGVECGEWTRAVFRLFGYVVFATTQRNAYVYIYFGVC